MLLDRATAAPATAAHARGAVGPASSRVLGAVAPALVVFLAVATAAGELGHLVGWRFLTGAWSSRVVLLLVLALSAAALWLTRGTPVSGRAGSDRLAPWLASAPGLLLVAYALVGQLIPLNRRAEWFLGGDHVRHLVFTVQEAVTGYLDYGVNSYPRAWHTAIATVWSAAGGQQDADGLLRLVALLSTGSWCLYAVFSLATGQLARALALRVGLSPAWAGLAGLAAGAMTLWPSFLSDYQVLGFENSILASLVIAVCAREVVARPDTLRAVLVCAAGVGVVANTWQLLLPAPLIALGVVGLATVRSGTRAARAVALVVGVLGVLVAAPGVLAVLSRIGIDHATDAGVEAPLPWVLMPLGLLATTATALRWRRDLRVLALAGMVLVTAATAPALAAKVGIPVTLYYPSKILWSSAALALAPLGVVLALGVAAVWRFEGALALVSRSAVAAVAGLLVALCAYTPATAVLAWATVDGDQVLGTLQAPDAGAAQVVWLPGELSDSTISRILLDFYRVGGDADFLPQQPLGVAQECEVLRASPHPAVLSTAPADQVLARYACVPDVRVVPVPRPAG